jgi:hypothetical protein
VKEESNDEESDDDKEDFDVFFRPQNPLGAYQSSSSSMTNSKKTSTSSSEPFQSLSLSFPVICHVDSLPRNASVEIRLVAMETKCTIQRKVCKIFQ